MRSDNLTRSRNLLIDYVCENSSLFKSFVTLTFKENIKSIDEANKRFNIYLTRVRKYCKEHNIEFFYIGVPEFQKRGAVHYHLLMSLVPGCDLLPKQQNQENKYDVKYWDVGFSSAFDLSLTDEKFNIALYITKYMYKDLDSRLYGRTRVLKSNNLKKPNEVKVLSTDPQYLMAKEYIKRYDEVSSYEVTPSDDKPFIIPSTITQYTSSTHTNNSTLLEIFKFNTEQVHNESEERY